MAGNSDKSEPAGSRHRACLDYSGKGSHVACRWIFFGRAPDPRDIWLMLRHTIWRERGTMSTHSGGYFSLRKPRTIRALLSGIALVQGLYFLPYGLLRGNGGIWRQNYRKIYLMRSPSFINVLKIPSKTNICTAVRIKVHTHSTCTLRHVTLVSHVT